MNGRGNGSAAFLWRSAFLLKCLGFFTDMAAGYPCLGDVGMFVINIKIYVDETSAKELNKYMKNLLAHNADFEPNTTRDKLYYTKMFFGLIFDKQNAQLKESNIQLYADFSDMLENNYQNMKEKYCTENANIIGITDDFLNEFNLPEKIGENKILVLDCSGNHPLYPTRSHIATKNGCGHAMGFLYEYPDKLRESINAALYQVIGTNSQITSVEPDQDFSIGACHQVNTCKRRFRDFGFFEKGLHSIGSPGDLEALQYFSNEIWSFGHALHLERSPPGRLHKH